MSTEDIIRAWKDPDGRDQAADADHPAGRIDLSGGNEEITTMDPLCASISIVIGLSQLLECKDSLLHGTCGAWSYGCC